MIEKITDFGVLSGVSSPLLPLIFADASFSQNEIDGAFLQKAENNEIQAVFSLKNTCVSLVCISDQGTKELETFFNFCGVTEILSDKPLTQFCNSQKELNLLELCGKIEQENNCFSINSKSTINEYKAVYNVISEQGTNFEMWFPEFSKKINSSDAFATYLKVDERVVSAAISPAVYENTAIIAGVYTLKEYRNKGFAGVAVKGLLDRLKGNNISKVYLWCEDGNIDFYNKLNFKNTGKLFFGECN